ncbi:MAG: serine hydrolase [Cyanobacteriota bacterium]|nr:serine hydrolase [Cyanobacteriota bacterium]
MTNNQWQQQNKTYKVGDIVLLENQRYRCLQEHTTNGDYNWNPAIAKSLWQEDTSKRSLSSEEIAKFKSKFDARRKFYNIPGAALGIVQNGQVVVSEGFGLRDLQAQAEVTPKTVFAIGSMSKSVTALTVGTQVDEGVFAWDTPVRQISSQYQFPPAINYDVTVKDLMGMNSGIDGAIDPFAKIPDPNDPSTAILGINGSHWNDQTGIYTIKTIPDLPCFPADVEERAHLYNNELFASAGYLTPLKNQTPLSELLHAYKQLVRQKVFNPIGMVSSSINGTLSSVSDDYAVSYGLDMSGGKAKTFEKGPVSINYINGVGPAGQIVSNVEDMNRYLITILNDGVNPEGKRVINANTLQQLWNIEGKKTVTNTEHEGITGVTTYGMGWWVEEIPRKSSADKKVTVRHHGGFLPSWACMQMLIPEQNAGMVILSNGCFGREFTMEMNQELLNLFYDSDLNNFIDNEAGYNKFVNDLEMTFPQKVSSYTVNYNDVEVLLGNYQGGWTLEMDAENRLVLFKNGWIYHLYPSREKRLFIYYTGASNNHRGMRVSKNADDSLEGAKIWFVLDDDDVINMIGAQIGQVKKLPNLLESDETRTQILSILKDIPLETLRRRPSPRSVGAPPAAPPPGISIPKASETNISVSEETTRYLRRNLQLD